MGALATERDDRDSVRRNHEFSLQRANDAPPELDASEDDKAHYVLARFSIQNDHYTGLYKQWAKPLFFLVGKHWITWNTRTLSYDLEDDVPEWRQQPVTNYTYAVYRSWLSKLTKQRPTHEVVPPSGDSDDREAAKVGDAVLRFLWRELKQARKVKRVLGWMFNTSLGHIEIGWDPESGPLVPQTVLVEIQHPDLPDQTVDQEVASDDDGEPLRRESTGPNDLALDGGDPFDFDAEPTLVPIGEVGINVIDPLSVRLNPEATDYDEAEEYYVASLWPRGKVEEVFGVDANELIATSAEEANDGGRGDFENVMSSVSAAPPDPFSTQQQVRGSSQDQAIGERILVIKYYRKRSAKYPKGRHWITAGGAKVWPRPPKSDFAKKPTKKKKGGEASAADASRSNAADQSGKQFKKSNYEAPLPFGFWPPIITIVDTPIPGQPQGVANASQVAPLNEQLNHLDGKIGEYHTMMAMGGVIWVTPADKDIEITSEPGQVKVSKGFGESGKYPIREKLEALPDRVYQEREVIERKISIIAGTSSADLAQRPEGVTSGRGILALQEASDAPLMPTLEAMEELLEEMGRRILRVVQRCYSDERTIKIRGEKGRWEYVKFKGADLTDGLDVEVLTGSSFPWSKSAQWDSKISLITALPGLVVNPMTGEVNKEALAHYLDAGPAGFEPFDTDEDPDLVEVEREIQMFEEYDPATKGETPLPQPAFWQNQPKRLDAFYTFMKRDYSRFEKWSPAAQFAFVQHMQQTAMAVSQIAATAAAASGAVAPPMGGGGAGPAPASGQNGNKPQLVPPGGPEGRAATPGARQLPGGTAPLRLTPADRRAAGQ